MITLIEKGFNPRATVRDGSSCRGQGIKDAVDYLTPFNSKGISVENLIHIINNTSVADLNPHRDLKLPTIRDYININFNYYEHYVDNVQIFNDLTRIQHDRSSGILAPSLTFDIIVT